MSARTPSVGSLVRVAYGLDAGIVGRVEELGGGFAYLWTRYGRAKVRACWCEVVS